jgi:hypothetical protein
MAIKQAQGRAAGDISRCLHGEPDTEMAAPSGWGHPRETEWRKRRF